ncbi:SAC3/GANP/Nin1/mts3/eIF-3 p25 family-domain-containing protein [Cladorrhinum sp. PSN332]|nr:SAC3/GANP/Nin1/mts3/eIF-3 p25 family-domain-containing protein [Cladorrhinum sp. PSN332]
MTADETVGAPAAQADKAQEQLAAEISSLEIADDKQQQERLGQPPPHRSHDPQYNQKRTDPFQFGSRFLSEQDDPFEFNAWDHVETDDAYNEYAEQQYEMQRQSPVSDFDKSRFNSDPAKWWNMFYKNNTSNFFKDRKWLQQEFPVLDRLTREDAGPVTILEIGAGAGNTAFPVIARNKNPKLKLHACDFSKKAVEVMRASENYNTEVMQADVWDIAGEELPPGLGEGSVDLVMMVFIFSALSPLQWKKAVENVYRVLKPGGEVCFRDYGRGDLAQVRFRKGRYLEENFYIRGDGTRVYFFDKDELADIWSGKLEKEAAEEQVPRNQFLAPTQTSFGAPQANNPFGAPSSASRSASPFGVPSVQQNPVFATPFGSASQSRIPTPNPGSSNPFGKPTTPSSFGAQPAGGFGTHSASESAAESDMAGRKRTRNAKSPAQNTAPNKKGAPPASGFTPSGFGSQGEKPGSQRAGVFGKHMDKSLLKAQPRSQTPQQNGRMQFSSAGDINRNGSARDSLERTKELSPFAFDFASKLNDHLRKEKIKPPTMPPEPGNPKKRGDIESTKEAFKKYRTRVYASLRKVEYIDDPEKRRKLKDALPFKGICEGMCPDFERVARIAEYDIKTEEKTQGSDGSMWPDPAKMVKKFGRSAAGQDAPLPMDVRSVGALQRSVDYLFKDLLQSENNLPSMHNFLWDRTRAIRKDFTFHSQKSREEMKVMVYIFETITRFHATSLHLLSRKGFANDDFDQKQEIEQLGRTLLSLMEAYDVCHDLGVVCPNEPEFRAYYLLLNAHDPSIPKRIITWGKETWFRSQEVQTALSLISVMDDIRETKGPLKPRRSPTLSATAFRTFFTIVENPRVSYTMACIAEVHFTYVRQNILKNFVKGYARHRDAPRTITASDLNKVLRFDTDEEAAEFVELHDFEFTTWVPPGKNPVPEPYLLLNSKKRGVPSPRVRQAYSGKLVERKRTTESIVDAIYTTIYEKSNGQSTQMVEDDPDSLFVTQAIPAQPAAPFFAQATAPAATVSPSPFGGGVTNTPFANGFGTQQTAVPPTSVFSGLQNPQPATSVAASSFAGFNKPTEGSPAAFPTTAGPLAAFRKPTATASTGPLSRFGQPANTATSPVSTTPAHVSVFGGQGTTAAPPTASAPSVFSSPFGQPASKTDAAKGTFPSIPSQQISSLPTAPYTASPLPAFGQSLQPTLPPQPIESTTPKKDPPPSLFKSIASPQASSFPSTGQKPLPSFGNIVPPPATVPSSTQPVPSFLGLGTASSAKSEQPPLSTQTISTSPPAPAVPSILLSQPSPALPAAPPVASTFKPVQTTAQPPPSATPFQFPGQAPLPAASSSQNTPLFSTTLAPPPPPPPPKRDLLGDITKWYVLGDNGLMEQFTENTLHNMLWNVFEAYQKSEEDKKRKAEDDESWRVAREHMAYRLEVKYFYRWRESARKLAQKRILREGKQRMREYREQQLVQKRTEEEARLKAEQDARRAARRKAEADRLQLSLIAKAAGQQRRRNSIAFSADGMNAEEQLLKSGIFAGLRDERGLVRRAVNNEISMGGVGDSWAGVSKMSYRYPESELELEPARRGRDSPDNASSTGRREGWKTRSLREKFGIESRRSVSASGSVNGNFRASLPLNRSTNFSAATPSGKRSIAGSSDGEPDAKRKSILRGDSPGVASGVSVISKSRHWDLRARGFVPMPDGNWLPESMVNSRQHRHEAVDIPVVPASDGEDEPNSLRARLARLKQGGSSSKGGYYGHASRRSIAGSVGGGGMSPPPPPPLWKDTAAAVVVNKRKRDGEDEDVDMEREISPPEKKVFTNPGPRQDTNSMVANTQRMLRELRETMDRLDQDNRTFYQEQGIGSSSGL